jgi:acetyltransferase-like isoleucine patch superfamily enzyme
MLDQPLLLEPLLRLMPLPATLIRHATVSAERRLRTVDLRETPLVAGVAARFDDSCKLTTAEGIEPSQLKVKMAVQGPARKLSGVHLTILSAKGQLHITIGDDDCRLFIGSETVVRGGIHLLNRATAFIGDRTVIGNQSRLIVNNADLVIGQECHLVEDVLVQCNDPHLVVDLSNGELLNGARQRTYLGRHVLVNPRAMLMPGVRVGDGAIIQAGALVLRDVAPNTLVGGVPAAILREQVGWQEGWQHLAAAAASQSDGLRAATQRRRHPAAG